MYIRTVRNFWKTALVLIGAVISGPIATAADAPETSKVVDGLAIYVGVMPAEILQGHPKEHLESRMHGGVPIKGHRDHVVVALFDDATGRRIENARVVGSVIELDQKGKKQKFEKMKLAGTVTYGNYFDMPDQANYHITLWIRRPGTSGVVEAKFSHRHFDQ